MGLLVAVDGGGTKTELVLARSDGTVLRRCVTGPTNPNDIGLSRALDVLCKGVAVLLGQETDPVFSSSGEAYTCSAGKAETVSGLFAGIAGTRMGTYRQEFAQRLSERFGCPVHCDSDAVCALTNGLGRQDGCAVICGTGSVGYAKKGHVLQRVGGNGYLFDKGGSGYDFGRDAVIAALYQADGRGPRTCLLELIEAQLGMRVSDALPLLYREGKVKIASLSVTVFEACRQGDAVAEEIVAGNMRELAILMNALANLVHEMNGRRNNASIPMVLSGGMFERRALLLPYLYPYLQADFEMILPQTPPVFGALLEAAGHAGVDTGNEFQRVFSESYATRTTGFL